jgi:hypothetical protein
MRFEMACERPPRLRGIRWLRAFFINRAATPPQEEGNMVTTNSAPVGVPVGIELLGAEWSEPVLIKLAYAFEVTAKIRKPPRSTPPLNRGPG